MAQQSLNIGVGMMKLLPQMYQPYKYRLYPFKAQERELLRQLSELNYLWNHALEERSSAWKGAKHRVSYVGQCHSLTRWRNYDKGGLGRVYAQVAQDTLHRLDEAFQRFFLRCKLKAQGKWKGPLGYPQFKRETFSLTYSQANNGSVKFTDGRNHTHRLYLSKIGHIPIELDRRLPVGKVKTCTVKREGDRWFIILTYEVANPAPPTGTPQKPVGVDIGLTHLATLSTGEMVEPPKFLRHMENLLKRRQRDVSRKVKGSRNREKAKVRLARCHAKVRDQRRDFAHKLTTGWADTYDLIGVEDMDVRNMMGNHHLAKSIGDSGWGMLRQMAEYKMRNHSKWFFPVDAKNTTQSCSKCGQLADPKLTLKDRVLQCPCGHTEDRDVNAAKNIVKSALAMVPGGTGETTPVETGPPPARKGRRVRSKKQEPPCAIEVALEGA